MPKRKTTTICCWNIERRKMWQQKENGLKHAERENHRQMNNHHSSHVFLSIKITIKISQGHVSCITKFLGTTFASFCWESYVEEEVTNSTKGVSLAPNLHDYRRVRSTTYFLKRKSSKTLVTSCWRRGSRE